MSNILNDSSKFNTYDNTSKAEMRRQRWLLSVSENNLISKKIYNRVRPVGSQCPRMYGQPKIHKDGVPMRPPSYL